MVWCAFTLLFSLAMVPSPGYSQILPYETWEGVVDISEDTLIETHLWVSAGTVVKIKPNVTVTIKGPEGVLDVKGTPENPVFFQLEGEGYWGGLEVKEGHVDMEHTVISGAVDGIMVEGGKLVVNHVTVNNTERDGVRLVNGASGILSSTTIRGCNLGLDVKASSGLRLSDSDIYQCLVALSVDESSAEIHGCDIGPTGYTGIDATKAALVIEDSSIRNNLYGILAEGKGGNISVTNCVVGGNRYAVDIRDGSLSVTNTVFSNNDAGMNLTDVDYIIEEPTFTNNEKYSLRSEHTTILTITNISGEHLSGNLTVTGTGGNPVTDTSYFSVFNAAGDPLRNLSNVTFNKVRFVLLDELIGPGNMRVSPGPYLGRIILDNGMELNLTLTRDLEPIKLGEKKVEKKEPEVEGLDVGRAMNLLSLLALLLVLLWISRKK